MYVAAHEDDDLLFMNPDIMTSIDQATMAQPGVWLDAQLRRSRW